MQSRLTLRSIVLAFMAAWLHIAAPIETFSFQQPRGLTRTVSWREVLENDEIRMPLCDTSQSSAESQQLDIRMVSLPSGVSVPQSAIRSVRTIYENGYYLLIKLRSNVRPNDQDEELKVTIPASQENSDITRLQQIVCSFPATLPEVLAREKTSSERRMLMAPSMSFPAGGGAEMAVNGHLYRGNMLKLGNLINQIDFTLTMDKVSEVQADPNYFNLGVDFKKVIPFHWNKLNRAVKNYRAAATRLRTMNAETMDTAQFTETENLIGSAVDETLDLKRAFFRDIEMKAFSPRLEMNFSGLRPGPVINFINNSELQLNTASKPFISKNLFWSLKLVPVGLESGVTLRNRDNVIQRGHGIVRLNTGGTVKLKFRFPCRDDLLADRIELEIKGINRYLFNEESAFNPITKRNDLLVKGSRYSAQVDLRYIFGFTVPVPTRIFGFKLPNITRKPAVSVVYKNGYFPPVYGFNNSVRVRFTLASGDEDNSSDIRVSEENLLRP